MILEDRLILHDLRGVNLKVGFFLGSRQEFMDRQRVSYTLCWDTVDVRVDLVTCTEKISELDFFYSKQQLFIDDQILSGELVSFSCSKEEDKIVVHCILAVGRD